MEEKKRRPRRKLDIQFKLGVLKDYYESGCSWRASAANIPSAVLISVSGSLILAVNCYLCRQTCQNWRQGYL